MEIATKVPPPPMIFSPRDLLAFFLLLFFCGLASPAVAIDAENVLVLYNADDGPGGSGAQIANHYQQVHPNAHVAGISGINAILSGTYSEEISGDDYLNVLRPQILSELGSIPDSIDVIVTTKGMPLRIDVGSQPGGNSSLKWKRYSSLESELNRIDSIDSIDEMGDQFLLIGFPAFDFSLQSNPYYNKNIPFVRSGSDLVNGDIRLSSRLDGYSVGDVINSIDRAQNVFVNPSGHFIVADDDPTAGIDQIVNNAGEGAGLITVLQNHGQAFISDYDQGDAVQNTAIAVAPGPVVGYVSHGTNDGAGGLEPGYIQNQLDFELANGAVFHTHESFNARSFDPAHSQGQGLVAEWLEIGGTAGLGHVQEPFNGPDNVTNEDLFYDMLLPSAGAQPGETGLTFVEAAWNATRQLSFVNTVVGDPLMTFQAWLPGDTNLDGVVEFNDFFMLQGNWQQPGGFEDGDFDGDGMVDEDDFDILQANWLASVAGVLPSGVSEITVYPMIEDTTGWPVLNATLLREANLNGDLNVDGDDLDMLFASFGIDNGGDVDGDGDTDGADFLLWQQQLYVHSLTADFNIDGVATQGDLSIWENSFSENRGGDADGDGDTDGMDFLAWQREFIGTPAAIAAATVPEPSVGSLVGLACFLLATVSRRRT